VICRQFGCISFFSIDYFARGFAALASDFLLLVQKKVTKENDTRAGAGLWWAGLFALSGFDSPSLAQQNRARRPCRAL